MAEPLVAAAPRHWFPSRSVLLFGLGVIALWWLVLVTTPLWFNTFPRQSLPADFQLYFSGARIALQHGWIQIYDFRIQREEYYLVHPESDPFGDQVPFGSGPTMKGMI